MREIGIPNRCHDFYWETPDIDAIRRDALDTGCYKFIIYRTDIKGQSFDCYGWATSIPYWATHILENDEWQRLD